MRAGAQGQGSLADRQEALRRELERQRGNLPGAGSEGGEAARESLERADRAMRGAEEALRGDDLAEAIDRQAEAMEALREGMRNLGEALARTSAPGRPGPGARPGRRRSRPIRSGRRPGRGGQVGTQDRTCCRARMSIAARASLLDELRRRSGEGDRPEIELEYLERLLERF